MSEKVLIDGDEYIYVKDYRDNERLREGLNNLTEKTYGFNFRRWYESGYWGKEYIPYSLLDDDKLVANVSVSIMKINILGEEKNYIQIGTVMTDEEYRNQGLSRFLMEEVLHEWENKCDCIYLFANDTVLDFYPKFGFERVYEHQYSIKKNKEKDSEKVRKINIDDNNDKGFLENIISNSIQISKLYVKENKNLIMFYCLDFLKDNIYYIENYNAIAICEYNGEELFIQDVFMDKEIDLNIIINSLISKETKVIRLGFTPINIEGYNKELLNDDNDALYIKSKNESIFNYENIMFPTLSHA